MNHGGVTSPFAGDLFVWVEGFDRVEGSEVDRKGFKVWGGSGAEHSGVQVRVPNTKSIAPLPDDLHESLFETWQGLPVTKNFGMAARFDQREIDQKA